MKVLHLDTNHPILLDQLNAIGFTNHEDYIGSKAEIESKIHEYDGVIIRSRIKIDSSFLEKAANLKFIGRVGAGLENIDVDYAAEKGIELIAAPEGNRNAVGEHTLALLLNLLNKVNAAHTEVTQGIWKREENRGTELDGKTIGIIGYGNAGKAFAKKLKGFEVRVLCYDILGEVGDENAQQVSIDAIHEHADVLSLHVPLTENTQYLVDDHFIEKFSKPFWLLNTARGKCVNTADLANALKSGKIIGAGLDVLEYEKDSFEKLFESNTVPEAFGYLVNANNVILTPHIAGWTIESKQKLAQVVVDKIKMKFC